MLTDLQLNADGRGDKGQLGFLRDLPLLPADRHTRSLTHGAMYTEDSGYMTVNGELQSSRRKFLKTTALVGAGGVASAVAINGASPYVLGKEMVFEPNHSYWAKALPAPTPPLQQNIDVDVAVVGGGLCGLSTAYYLRKDTATRGRVVLLEAARCGNGASARNGAMMLTMTADRYMHWSAEPELDKRIYDLTAGNIRELRALSRSLEIDVEIEQNGALQVCNTRDDVGDARNYVRKARAAQIPCEFWEKEKVAEVLGTRAYEGAFFDPNGGQVHPGRLVNLFKASAQSAGVGIYEQTPVVHIDEGERITVTTRSGHTVRANSLVLATNSYTCKLGYLQRAVTPVFDYVAITAPLSEAALAEVGWKSRVPFNDCRTQVFYLGLTGDNRIHIGGGSVDYAFNNGLQEPNCAEARYAALHGELARIFPALAAEPFELCWGGLVDMSLDESPAVGRMGKHGNIFYAVGFSGHGVNLTSIFGQILADLIRGKGADWDWLPYLDRLPPYIPNEPFRWLGLQLALGYYKLTDPK
jgi:gamma-glutamylputrescine oxidase